MASPSIDVYVKLSTGRVVTFDLMPDQNVEEIYRKVAKEEDVFENQIVLRYTGKVVKKSHTIGYLGICRETILKSEIIELKVINIFVKQAGGDIVELTLNNLTTLSQVKKRIHDKQDIPTSTQILKLAKTVLSPDSESLLNLGVKDEDVLTLVIKKDENHQMEEEIEIEEDIKQELLNNFAADLPCNKVVEVVFSFDTTGSMYSCLQKVRDKLGETVTRLLKDIPKIRIGIMAHGDYCDDNVYVVKTIDLCSNVHKLVKFVVGVDATSGGDSPECYEWVLRRAQMLDWSEDSAKALVVIGDDLPHPVSYTDQAINWHDELDVLKGMGIKVYGVKANNNNYATPFYKELAEITDGAYIQFKHFSLITDMFLAVCYKESSEDQLQAYCEEVRTEGRMTEDMAQIFEQLEDKQKDNKDKDDEEEKPIRYIGQPWWDPALDKGIIQYYYKNGKWSNYKHPVRRTESFRTGTDVKPKYSKRTFSLRRSKTTSMSSVPVKHTVKGSNRHSKCSIQ